jgi:excisionase family DNA binding protein
MKSTITIREIAHRSGVHIDMIRHRHCEGRIPKGTLIGRKYLYTPKEADDIVATLLAEFGGDTSGPMPPGALTVAEAARTLDVPELSLRRLVAAGRLKAHRQGDDIWLPLSEVRRLQARLGS